MKKLLFLLLFIPIVGFGQYDTIAYFDNNYAIVSDVVPEMNHDYTSSYVGGLILLNTFGTLQIAGDNMSENQRGIVALTGMLTATASFFIIEYFSNRHYKKFHLNY